MQTLHYLDVAASQHDNSCHRMLRLNAMERFDGTHTDVFHNCSSLSYLGRACCPRGKSCEFDTVKQPRSVQKERKKPSKMRVVPSVTSEEPLLYHATISSFFTAYPTQDNA